MDLLTRPATEILAALARRELSSVELLDAILARIAEVNPALNAVVAMDAVDAGVGDKVLLTTESFNAMTNVRRPNSPIDMSVIGFIDHIELVQGVN